MKKLIIILSIILAVQAVFADKTTRKGLKLHQTVEATDTTDYCEIAGFPDSLLVLTGYDKPLGSDRESVFVMNKSEYDIDKINITIDYQDKNGRQLTSRTIDVICNIPAGETRQAYFKTWDLQHSFYYVKSRKPRTQATPYTVKCTINKVYVKKAAK